MCGYSDRYWAGIMNSESNVPRQMVWWSIGDTHTNNIDKDVVGMTGIYFTNVIEQGLHSYSPCGFLTGDLMPVKQAQIKLMKTSQLHYVR